MTTRFRAIRIGFLPKWDNRHRQHGIHSDLFDIDKKKNEKVEKRSPFEVNECIINFDESIRTTIWISRTQASMGAKRKKLKWNLKQLDSFL